MKHLMVMTLGAALLLGGCATGGGATDVKDSKSVKLDTHKLDVMAGKKQIYIGNVGVTFITEDSGSAKSSSPMIRHSSGGEYAKANLKAYLTGVPEDTFREITDGIYADLKAKLEANGYTVLSYAQLQQQKGWSKLKTLEQPYTPGSMPFSKKSANLTYAPASMDLVTAPDINNQFKIGDIAKDMGIPVLLAHYTIHFAYFGEDADVYHNYYGGPTGQGTTELKASVTLGQGIQVLAGSGVTFLNEGAGTFAKNGHIRLKDPIIVKGAYGENEDTTSAGWKAANALSSTLGFFSGSSSKTTQISVNANPAFYEEGVLIAATATNDRIVSELATAK
ncbi:MAG TPA: hypothetical protein DEA26_06135 [Oceanospirillales bacterium]|nr:hypothetical protein [Oceanospirillales bacterium]|tara:strand:- start:3770 stop:4774 length:1005 start_codon:yes stop_codon:yes gene_type:complete